MCVCVCEYISLEAIFPPTTKGRSHTWTPLVTLSVGVSPYELIQIFDGWFFLRYLGKTELLTHNV